jgi:uncharacterized membrane protein
LFVALAAHGIFTLSVPAFTLKRSLAQLVAGEGENHFFVMKTADQQRLFPTYPSQSVIGACVFNVGPGPVDLDASMPPGFWTLTIYSSSGDVLYVANDRQAGTNAFKLRLQQAPSLLEMLRNQANEESPVGSAWTVKTAERRGVVVLWQPLSDAALRPQVERVIAASRCAAAKKA